MFGKLSSAGVALCLVGIGLACADRGACERPLYFAEGATAVELDLDCDGTEDQLRVEVAPDSAGVTRRWLLLRGSRAEIPLEASIEIVGVADLNGDALDDVLLLGTDPGVAVPAVILSTVSGGTAARFSSAEIARSANLVFNEDVYADCPSVVRSVRFVQTSRGLGLSIPFAYDEEVTCETQLTEFTMLPAIPAWRITGPSTEPGHASADEIDQTYGAFLSAVLPSPPGDMDRGSSLLAEANDAMEALQAAQEGSPEELVAALQRVTASFEALRPRTAKDLPESGT
jgi:hypothetical protein